MPDMNIQTQYIIVFSSCFNSFAFLNLFTSFLIFTFVLELILIGKKLLLTRNLLYSHKYQMAQSFHEPVYNQPDPSFNSLDYTFAFSKYSCISWVYPLHIIFAYLVALTGFLALISRVIPKIRSYHYTFGRWYIIFMLWCMATSLLIHNAGLPMPIIISFLYLLISITIGWNAIRLYLSKISEEVRQRVNARINYLVGKSQSEKPLDIKQIEDAQRNKILASKSFTERFFSMKMLHGIMFAFSWAQMIGRIFVTNPFTSFSGCWTYPAYKSLSQGSQVYAIDSVSTPPFPMKDGVFIAVITAPTVAIILIVACCTTYCFYKSENKVKEQVNPSPQNPSDGIFVC